MARRRNRKTTVPFIGALRENELRPQIMVVQPRNQKKKNKKKSKGRKRMANANNNNNPALSEWKENVCALINPFCAAARGVRWPDGSLAKTLTFTVRGSTTMTVDTNGSGALLINPNFPYGTLVASAMTGSVATVGGAFSPFQNCDPAVAGSYGTFIKQSRLTCGGVRIMPIAALLSAAGTISILEIRAAAAGTPGTIDVLNPGESEFATRSLSNPIESTFLFKPCGTTARQFAVQNTNSSNYVSNDWTSLCIGIIGAAASSTPLRVEYVLQFEAQAETGTAMATMATMPPPDEPKMVHTTSAASRMLDSFTEGGALVVDRLIAGAVDAATVGVRRSMRGNALM
jgi:hypothetical protein